MKIMKPTVTISLIVAVLLGFAVRSSASALPDGKRALMWIDGEANFKRFSSPDSIDWYVAKLARMGFSDVVVDVRPITGEVLFNSPYAPTTKEWQGFTRPDFDYLGRFIQAAHSRGMKVQASLNCFSGGHNYFDRGVIYSSHPEWVSWVYLTDGRIVPMTEKPTGYDCMIDPLNEDFRRTFVLMLQDLVRQYPSLDGIVLDRVRYDGLDADFSDHTRRCFEKHIGQSVKRWPQDIFTWTQQGGQWVPKPGRWFRDWILWRSQIIHDAMKQMRKAVKDVRPTCSFGTYTGAWYPSYYEVGVNFASNKYDPYKEKAYSEWATPGYKQTGYAELLDLYMTGNYFTDITIKEHRQANRLVWNETDTRPQSGDWFCVEGACRGLRTILDGRPFYGGILVDQLLATPGKIADAVAMNLKQSDGVMVFDICYLAGHEERWKEIAQGLSQANQ